MSELGVRSAARGRISNNTIVQQIRHTKTYRGDKDTGKQNLEFSTILKLCGLASLAVCKQESYDSQSHRGWRIA